MLYLFALFVVTFVAALEPEQVRIGYGLEKNVMRVSWNVIENASQPLSKACVKYGLSANSLDKSNNCEGEGHVFHVNTKRNFTTYIAEMTDLKEATRYFYAVGDGNTWSETFSFRSRRDPNTDEPHLHVILGDMGAGCAFSLCDTCTCDLDCRCNDTSRGLISEVGRADMMLHVGDFGYNLDSNDGLTGDAFFKNIEPVAASVPYMVSVGNHEDSDTALARFVESFRHMPTNKSDLVTTLNGQAPNNLYYSWDAGLVHYVAISTEIYFNVPKNYVPQMYAWLEQDLKKAQENRKNVPWIVVHGHRSVYCSCDGDCDTSAQVLQKGPYLNGTYGIEDLLFKYGVDFFINGHEHDYERMWPTYKGNSTASNINPKATIYIVQGAAGCDELHEPFTRPQPPRSAFRANTFGYSRLWIYNATHIKWESVMTDPTFFPTADYGKIIDETWVVQEKHGPFNLLDAPKTPGQKRSQSRDHWDMIFGEAIMAEYRDDISSNENLVEMISGLRESQGEDVWKKIETSVLARYNAFFNSAKDTVWEDTSDDGNSDGKFDHEKPWLKP